VTNAREQRTTRDGQRHLTIERNPTNITPPRRQDGQAVAYRAISKMYGRGVNTLTVQVSVSELAENIEVQDMKVYTFFV